MSVVWDEAQRVHESLSWLRRGPGTDDWEEPGTNVAEDWAYCVFCGDILDWWEVGGPDNASSWAWLKKEVGKAFSGGTFVEGMRLSKQHLDYTCGAECAWMILDHFNPGEVDLRELLFHLMSGCLTLQTPGS